MSGAFTEVEEDWAQLDSSPSPGSFQVVAPAGLSDCLEVVSEFQEGVFQETEAAGLLRADSVNCIHYFCPILLVKAVGDSARFRGGNRDLPSNVKGSVATCHTYYVYHLPIFPL